MTSTMMKNKIRDVSFPDAKKAGMNVIDLILEFTVSALKIAPGLGFEKVTRDLKILKEQIQTCNGPFLDENIAETYVGLSLHQIITWYKPIRPQLGQFYNAHLRIADFAFENPEIIDYDLLNICETRREQVIKVNEISNYIIPNIKSNKNDKAAIYALFYNHILKTESTEYAFIDALAEFVKKMKEHDSLVNINMSEIFSVLKAVPTRNHKFVTDGRAIRSLLAHNHFKLILNDKSWSVHFKSPFDWEYSYHRTFTGDQFIEFVSITDLLYKSTFSIIALIMLINILKNRFVRPPLFPL